jgi:RimJ/RimL family protein N-acetyltransferase
LIVHNHPIIAKYVAEALGEEGFGECYTIGNVKNNILVAGVVFNNYTGLSVQMTAAGVGHWCTHELLNNCFSFVFNGLKCKRITVLVAKSNTKALKLNKHLGFIEEGIVRMGEGDEDLILLGMLKSECRYI